MGSLYVYEPNEEDFSTIGICGELFPEYIRFHEIANQKSWIEVKHPIDDLGCFTFLQQDYILKADVPVRSVPEISNGQYISVVEKWTVKNTATKNNRYIYSTKDSSKNKKKLYLVPAGGEVYIIAKYSNDSDRWKCKYTYTVTKKKKTTSKTVTGYIAHDSTTLQMAETRNIPSTPDGIETIAPSWNVEEQLFRIRTFDRSDDGVTLTAEHISYDLLYNLTGYSEDGEKTLQEAADGVLANCFDDHDFVFQTNISGTKSGFHFTDKDPITAFLDPEIGLVKRWDGQLIRDNYTFTVLDQAGVNRGVTFWHGKNTESIKMKIDTSKVATAIRPVGEKKDGTPLYLPHSYLVDENWDYTELPDTNGIVYGTYHSMSNGELTCALPFAKIWPLKGDNCKVDSKSGVTEAIVQARLLDQSIESLKTSQTPEISIDVNMLMLGYTQKWALFREMEKAFIFDTVNARSKVLRINADVTVSELEWDSIDDKPISYKLGTVQSLMPSVASWQIKSFDGTKLIPGTVGASQMADESISSRLVQAGAIIADALAAGSVTAQKIAAGSVEAGHLAVGAVDAGALSAITAKIQSLRAGDIETDTLAAALAAFTVVTAGSATFDKETVRHLIAGLLDVGDVIGTGNVTLKNVVIDKAQVLNATLDKVVIKGEDGRYYQMTIDPDTGFGYEDVTDYLVSEYGEELLPGTIVETEDGSERKVIETDLSVQDLSVTGMLDAIDILTSTLNATFISTDLLFAGDAFISSIRGTEIISGSGKTVEDFAEEYERMKIGGRNYLRSSRSLAGAEMITDGVYQTGNQLHIISGVEVTQSGTALHIE